MATKTNIEIDLNITLALEFAKWCSYHGWRKHYSGVEYKETPYWFKYWWDNEKPIPVTDKDLWEMFAKERKL